MVVAVPLLLFFAFPPPARAPCVRGVMVDVKVGVMLQFGGMAARGSRTTKRATPAPTKGVDGSRVDVSPWYAWRIGRPPRRPTTIRGRTSPGE